MWPFLYIIFLTCLLVHRTFRDEEKCAVKYGHNWERYCREVPFRLIPHVFWMLYTNCLIYWSINHNILYSCRTGLRRQTPDFMNILKPKKHYWHKNHDSLHRGYLKSHVSIRTLNRSSMNQNISITWSPCFQWRGRNMHCTYSYWLSLHKVTEKGQSVNNVW